MNPFIYTGIPIFLIGWIGLIIMALSFKFEEDIRDKLIHHQLTRTEAPASILTELKMAELLVNLESTETKIVKFKVMYKV